MQKLSFKGKLITSVLVIIAFLSLIFSSSCRKDENFASKSVPLRFSQDTIVFDTIFTTVGSVTQWLKVYNKEPVPVLIDKIYLAGGAKSNYRINIDGKATLSAENVELGAGDSIYIFVEVTIDPNNSNNPIIITDSIVFINKGKIQDVKLVAWGQDAHFIVPNKKIGNIPYRIVAAEGKVSEWGNDKPWVVYGYAVVDSTGMLKISKGANIHFHNNSGIWVYKGGSIKVNGTIDEPVVFQGDRTDPYYRDLPGQWDRIWINEGSVDNEFNYAIIKNGFIGIQAEILQQPMGNKLILNNTIIENMSGRALFTRSYKVEATNCLMTNSGDITVYLAAGGSYDFRHTTIANYWPYGGASRLPALVVANYEINLSTNTIYTGNLDKAYFGNCIIYGTGKEEVLPLDSFGGTFNYLFDHCLLKTTKKISQSPTHFVGCITRNQELSGYDPGEKIFKDPSENNWQPDSLSVVVDKGAGSVIINAPVVPKTLIEFDIKGDNRINDQAPDIGAYEFYPSR